MINAHRVNAGLPPRLSGFADFFWFGCDDTEETAGLIVDIVAHRIPRRFGLDPRRDVQVLTPMHRGPAGAGNLNLLLQEQLTPQLEGQPERRYGGRVFRVGDKVTQLRNNYDKGAAGIFNGTVGVITGISLEDGRLTVRTDEDESIDYAFDELDELAHAYAADHSPLAGQRVPGRGHPAHHQLLDDAAAQPALHRDHPGQEAGRPGRVAPGAGRRRAHPWRGPPPHRADLPHHGRGSGRGADKWLVRMRVT